MAVASRSLLPSTRSRLLVAICVFAICAAIPQTAHAAEPGANRGKGIVLAPSTFPAVDLDPGGAPRNFVVTVTNTSDSPVPISLMMIPLRGSSDPDRTAEVDDRTSPFADAARTWFTFPRGNDAWPVLAPGVTRTIRVGVRVPPRATPGTYAFAIGAFTRVAPIGTADDDTETSRVALNAGPGSRVVINVSGKATSSAKIHSVDAPRVVWGGHAATFVVRAQNTGTTLLDLDARITLSPFLVAAGRTLDATAQPTLPEGEREFTLRWNDPPLFGWFQPELHVVGGAGTGVDIHDTLPTVWVLPPWWIVLLVVLAMLLPMTAAVRRRRSGRARAMRSARARARIERAQRVAVAKQRAADARRGDRRH